MTETDLLKGERVNHAELKGTIDVLVITMKTEERNYVQRALGPSLPMTVPSNCPAVTASVFRGVQQPNPLFVAHCQILNQGPGSAQEYAHLLIPLLDPKWIFVVGICGISPKEPTITLGDILLATRVYGPLNRAQSPDGEARASDPIGSPLSPEVESLGSNIGLLWNSDPASALRSSRPWLPMRPKVNPKRIHLADHELHSWNEDIRTNLTINFSKSSGRELPSLNCVPFFSDAILRKSPAELERELMSRRDVVGIEMEIGGTLHAARRHRHVLVTTIRGVSDIVGLKRDESWTNYAAATAAAGLRFILNSGLLEAKAKPEALASEIDSRLELMTKTNSSGTDAGQTSNPDIRLDEILQGTSDSAENWFAIESDEATNLLSIAAGLQRDGHPVSTHGLKTLAARIGIFWIDRFMAEMLASYSARRRANQANCLADIVADYASRRRPPGDPALIRYQAEECALHAHWDIQTKKPFDRSIVDYACPHPIIQDYFIAQSLAWRYSAYSNGVKKSKADLRRIRGFMDRVYGCRVNQLMKEIIAQKSGDRQYEARIAKTVQTLLESSDGSEIPPAQRTHIYYVAGRIVDERLRRSMRDVLTKEVERIGKIVGASAGIPASSEYLMMWRSLYVSLGYLGNAEKLCDYIQMLLVEPAQDEHNRGFHLEYYGDQPLQQTGPTASVDRLLDFSLTKRTLIAKLASPSNATLLEAQTLASLAQKRHELGRLTSRDERVEISDVLRKVLKLRRPTLSAEDLNVYLEMVASDLLIENFRPETLIHSLNKVRHEPRTGWKLRGSPQVESVGAHTFSAMCLAMDFLPEYYASDNARDYSKLAVVSMLFNHDRAEGITTDIPSPKKTDEDNENEEKIMRNYGLLESYRLGRGNGAFGRIGFARARNYFMEFQQEKTFNARLAKEIDRIDAIYEALRLLTEHPNIANRELYVELIQGQWPKVQTDLGLYVLSRVLRMDEKFEDIAHDAVGWAASSMSN